MLAVTSRTRQPWMRNAVFRHNRQVPATIFNDLKLSRWLKIKPSMSVSESIASRASAAALAAPRRRVSIQCRIAPTFAALCVKRDKRRVGAIRVGELHRRIRFTINRENALKCQKVVRSSTSLRAYTSSTRDRFDLHVIFRYSLSQHQSTAVRSDSGRFPIRFLAWHAHVCQETLTFSQRLIAPWDQVNRRIPRQQSGGRSVRARGRGPIRIRA